MNSQLLSEVIEDAKRVRETALLNAKNALDDAFLYQYKGSNFISQLPEYDINYYERNRACTLHILKD